MGHSHRISVYLWKVEARTEIGYRDSPARVTDPKASVHCLTFTLPPMVKTAEAVVQT